MEEMNSASFSLISLTEPSQIDIENNSFDFGLSSSADLISSALSDLNTEHISGLFNLSDSLRQMQQRLIVY